MVQCLIVKCKDHQHHIKEGPFKNSFLSSEMKEAGWMPLVFIGPLGHRQSPASLVQSRSFSAPGPPTQMFGRLK